jgi:predicted RNase H-like HicB family nuclease
MAGVGEKINIQPLHDGKAKQYQVAQVRDAIERLGLYGMNMERYTDNYRTTMRWSDADHAYIVTMPALAGCMADGPTPEDALHELNIVADMWMADTRALGQDIPAPDRDLSTTRDLVGRVLTG